MTKSKYKTSTQCEVQLVYLIASVVAHEAKDNKNQDKLMLQEHRSLYNIKKIIN